MKWDPIDRPSDTVCTGWSIQLSVACCNISSDSIFLGRRQTCKSESPRRKPNDNFIIKCFGLQNLFSARSFVAYVYYWIFEYKSDKCLHYDPLAEELSHSARKEPSTKIRQQSETSLFSYNIDFRSTLSHVSVRFLLPRAHTHIHCSQQSQPPSNMFRFQYDGFFFRIHFECYARPYSDFYLFWIFQLIFFSLSAIGRLIRRGFVYRMFVVIGDVWRYYYRSRKQSAGHLSSLREHRMQMKLGETQQKKGKKIVSQSKTNHTQFQFFQICL